MGNTNFSSFHKNMAFWSLKPYSDINIYLIGKWWLFGIYFYHKLQCLLLKKYWPENLRYLIFCITFSKMFTSQNPVALLAGYHYSTTKNLEMSVNYLVPWPDNTWIPHQPWLLLVPVKSVLRHQQFDLSSLVQKALGL